MAMRNSILETKRIFAADSVLDHAEKLVSAKMKLDKTYET